MEAQLENYPTKRLAAATAVLALATAGFTWLTVTTNVQTGPLAVAAVSGAFTAVAASALGSLVHKRRAIRREMRTHRF